MMTTRTSASLAALVTGSMLALGCSSSSAGSDLGPNGGDSGAAKLDGSGDGGIATGDGAMSAGDGATGGDAAGGGDGAAAEAGRDGAADGATSGDAGAGDGSTGGPPPPGAVCSPTATWGNGTLLAASTPLDDALGAIAPDELSIAWSTGQGASAVIEIADRTAASLPFGTPQSVSAATFAADRVALSPDGLRLVAVNADRLGFSELTRTSRAAPGNTFGPPATGTYSDLNGALASGQSYGDPVLSADDTAFYYSVYGNGATNTVHRTARLFAGDPWPMGGVVQASTALAAQGTLRRRPTAISSDEQTLFFWDEVGSIERAAWINESTGVFDTFADLGPRSNAGPNAACTLLYYSAKGTSSVDLFFAGH